MLRLRVLDGRGRGVVADSDIPAGTDLLVSKPYASVSFAGFCTCGEAGTKACTACKHQGYCSTACQKADWAAHKLECSELKSVASSGRRLPNNLRLASRIVRRLRAEGSTPLEAGLARPAGEGAAFNAGLQAAYSSGGAVLSLDGHRADVREEQLVEYGQMAGMVVHVMGGDGKGSTTPRLCLDVLCKMACNVFTQHDGELKPWGVGLYPSAAVLNHSCCPNAIALFRGSDLLLRSVLPIAAGQEVTISYTDVAAPTPIRRARLEHEYFFLCSCRRCALFADYVAAHGPLLPSPITPLPIDAYTVEDRRMLGVKCEREGCQGMNAMEVYMRDAEEEEEEGDGGEDGEEGDGRRGSRGSASLLYPSICTGCTELPSQEHLRRVEKLMDRMDRSVEALKSLRGQGGGEGSTSTDAVWATGAALLDQALTLLRPEHHLIVNLANALTNAAISCGAFERAVAPHEVMLRSAQAAHPPGHPLPALQQALHGKLLLHLRRTAEAVACIRPARDALTVTHGAGHPLVEQLCELVQQAEGEGRGGGVES